MSLEVPIVVVAPATEPLTLEQVKLWTRIDGSEEDTILTLLIQMAREHFEGQTNRRLIAQTLRNFYHCWPANDFILPVGPVASISSIKYYGTDNTEYTLSASDYALSGLDNPPIARRAYNVTWPSVTLRPLNPIAIEYVAGYGDADDIPARPKIAMAALFATFYKHRESVLAGPAAAVDARLLPQHVQAFLDSLRIYS